MPENTATGLKVLFVGESWLKHTVHVNGAEHLIAVEEEEGAGKFLRGLADKGNKVTHVRSHEVSEKFPTSLATLQSYDVVVLSDIGSNAFRLTNDAFLRADAGSGVDRLQLIVDFVREGGGLLKIGGYLSYTGIDGRARYGVTPLADVLPVQMLPHDDRVECPEGAVPEILEKHHPAIGDVPAEWPRMMGYNQTAAKAGGTVIARINGDPLLVVKVEGHGRVIAFMSDVAPRWAPPEFIQWEHYPELWASMVGWAAGESY